MSVLKCCPLSEAIRHVIDCEQLSLGSKRTFLKPPKGIKSLLLKDMLFMLFTRCFSLFSIIYYLLMSFFGLTLSGGSWISSEGVVTVRMWTKEPLMVYPLKPRVSQAWGFTEY